MIRLDELQPYVSSRSDDALFHALFAARTRIHLWQAPLAPSWWFKNVMFAQEAVELMNSTLPTPLAGARLNIKSDDGDPMILIPSGGHDSG